MSKVDPKFLAYLVSVDPRFRASDRFYLNFTWAKREDEESIDDWTRRTLGMTVLGNVLRPVK